MIDFDDPDAVYAFNPVTGHVRAATAEEKAQYLLEESRRWFYVKDQHGLVFRQRGVAKKQQTTDDRCDNGDVQRPG